MLVVKIPLIGGITYATDHNDAQVAIAEAISCFCIAAEKYGDGVEVELERCKEDLQ